jgi:tetratricopeptide (TPR) repeat protein
LIPGWQFGVVGGRMNEIRAFVSHSFAENDAAIVDKFLKYFDTVAKLHPAFSWEHAEAAEPKLLSEKVLALIDNKNTFIGICTRHELTVSHASLSPVFLRPTFRKADQANLSWKTSDWIIQEIGMAKARNLEIILLMEDGVRRPGGLQGDVEYIPFTRNAPEKSFSKILEMFIALSPKRSGAVTAVIETASPIMKEPAEPQTSRDDKWQNPDTNWSRSDYEHAIFRMISIGDAAGADRINNAYLATDDAKEGENRFTWNARTEWARILFGVGGRLATLKELATKHPSNVRIQEYLAMGLQEFDHHMEAADQYNLAAHLVSDQNEIARLMGRAAAQYAEVGAVERIAEIVFQLRREFKSGQIDEMNLLWALRRVAEIDHDEDALIMIIERMLELQPDNINLRFSLAYKHSEKGNIELALANYLKVPYRERGSMVWNNLGVAFDHFQLREKAALAFQKSEEMGETLAMSNLANKLMNVGMTEEAQTKLDKALVIKNYHKSVTDSLSRLKEIPEEEEKELEKLLDKMRPKEEFYGSIARAVAHVLPESLPDRWAGSDCVLELSLSNENIRLTGTYEADANPFALYLPYASRKVKHRIEYAARLLGHSVIGVVKRTKENAESTAVATSLLATGDADPIVFMVLSDNQTELRVMENPYSTNPRFYSIKPLLSVTNKESA